MARVLLHCPLNISRGLEEMLKDYSLSMYDKYEMEVKVEVQPHRPTEESLFKHYIKKDELPDLIIGHANDFAELSDSYISEHFRSLPGFYPLRKELVDAGFVDPEGFFHTLAVIPFTILYNHKMIEEKELPRLWEDLLDSRWRNSILMPDEYRMVSVIIRTFMKANYPEKFNEFKANVSCKGSPVDVVSAVDEGQYPIGITNVAWARFSRHKNTRLIWPQDGAFCMPQVMVWSKRADERLFEMGNFLMSQQIQEYMAAQSFIPVLPEISLPPLVVDNNCSLHWEGWKSFLEVIKGTII